MAFNKQQLDAVEAEIASLKTGSFSIGELSVDQEKTLAALVRLREIIKAELTKADGIAFGKAKIDGVDA